MNFSRKKKQKAGIRYENNLNAPRMKLGKFTTNLISKELYKKWLYQTEFKDTTFQEFSKIWLDFVGVLQDELTVNPEGVRLGYYTGELRLNYVSKYDKPIDDKASDKAGKDLPALNWNTSGRLGKVVWSVNYSRKFNKKCALYAFHPIRTLSRYKAAKSFKHTPEIFKDNRPNKFKKQVKKDATNPWIRGQEILNKNPLEPVKIKKRSYFEREEGTEGS